MSKTIPAIMSKPLDMATKLKLCAEIIKAEKATDISLFQAGFTYAKIRLDEKRDQIQELSMEEKRSPPKLLKRFTYSGEDVNQKEIAKDNSLYNFNPKVWNPIETAPKDGTVIIGGFLEYSMNGELYSDGLIVFSMGEWRESKTGIKLSRREDMLKVWRPIHE